MGWHLIKKPQKILKKNSKESNRSILEYINEREEIKAIEKELLCIRKI